MNLRVLLADDHTIIRSGLRALLDEERDLTVVGEAGHGREAVEMARELRPHIVVMDAAMPELNGFEATRQIKSEHEHVEVVALSMHADPRYVRRMFEAGASAYLLKDCAVDELLLAIRAVYDGKPYVSPGIPGVAPSDYARWADGPRRRTGKAGAALSPREREVLQLMAEGRSTKQIAADLYLSAKTIETHRKHIMEKLELYSVAELTKYAIREGITSLGN